MMGLSIHQMSKAQEMLSSKNGKAHEVDPV